MASPYDGRMKLHPLPLALALSSGDALAADLQVQVNTAPGRLAGDVVVLVTQRLQLCPSAANAATAVLNFSPRRRPPPRPMPGG
jgi:hypothetical protein